MGLKFLRKTLVFLIYFLADDNFIFCNASIRDIREVKDILDNYCSMSGQLVNFNKSATYFSKSAYQLRCKNLSTMLGVRIMNESERYLGNPILFKRNKNLCFDTFILKIRKKTRPWQVNVLSQAGRNTLLKSVVSSLSVYDMSALQLPNKTLLSMDKMMRYFGGGLEWTKESFTPLSVVTYVSP